MRLIRLSAPPFQVGYIPAMQPGAPIAPAPPVMEQPIMIPQEDEPPNKKSRTEDNLIPEAQFITMHKVSWLAFGLTGWWHDSSHSQSPVTIQVQVPNATDKSEWRLNGQTIPVVLDLTDTVSALKAKVQDETGMPPAKQKISYEVIRKEFVFQMEPS